MIMISLYEEGYVGVAYNSAGGVAGWVGRPRVGRAAEAARHSFNWFGRVKQVFLLTYMNLSMELCAQTHAPHQTSFYMTISTESRITLFCHIHPKREIFFNPDLFLV